MTARLTLPFKDIDKNNIALVGGKGANLGEMVQENFPVPDGFAVTVASFDLFLKENSLDSKIIDVLRITDIHNPTQLQDSASKIQKLVLRGRIPTEMKRIIINDYNKLSKINRSGLVAVRSSATAEDLPDASFAGQQASYLNVKGDANLIEAVRKCWASLYTARAIFYRAENKINHNQVKISVIVQSMLQSKVSGVMFTIDPVTNDKDKIIIEAIWGLGEYIVQGQVIPDRYTVQKDTFSILSKEIVDQDVQLIKTGKHTKKVKVPKKLVSDPKLTDDEIIKLAKIGRSLHQHYYFPQDIEWVKTEGDKDNLYIVQTRPVTTIKKRQAKKLTIEKDDLALSDTPILEGISASPGMATGIVKIVKNPKEISKVSSGDILVSEMTSPDFVPAMKKAAGIVTDKGGQTSHAAIVSRELGIPCIVGTKKATQTLSDNQVITINATKGFVFMGKKVIIEKITDKKYHRNLKTATKLYVNLGEPDLARKVAKLNVDGVGLLRAEFMIANIGLHPKEAIKLKKQDHFVDQLSSSINIFCDAFSPRPVVYRATDFKTNEYRQLTGGKNWEPNEPNPMLGYRGAYRYLADPEVFTLELRALKEVQKKNKNFYLMIPFVRSPEELTRVKRMVAAEGLFENPNFKFWMMVELPINVILIDKFIEVGIDGVSIGSNDLTMLLTGTDRDNEQVAQAFNERSSSVLWAIKRTVRHCQKKGVTSSICGQAPSVYDELVNRLVGYKITSVSVNPDAIDRVRSVIYEAEKSI